MGRKTSKEGHLRRIVERSQFWDAEDFVRNFDREMAQIERGLGHMIWDMEDKCVTAQLRPLPMTPRFNVSEDEKQFKLVVRLPGVSKEDIKLNVDKRSVHLFACTGDAVCKPYYVSVDSSGELDPASADASMSGDSFQIRVAKSKKKRLKVK